MKSNTLTFTRYFKIALGFLALIFCILIITACTDPKFTISFDTGLGSNIAPITNYQNTTIQNPGTPTKDGYDFIGWQLDGVTVTFPLTLTRNKTLVAIWEQIIYQIPDPVRHTITFDTGLGTDVDAITNYAGSSIQAPANPIKAGYDFIGWRLDGAPVTFPLELLSDKTLTAGWARIIIPIPIRHTITFDTGLGSNIDPITDYFKATILDPGIPIKDGYDFDGWIFDDGLVVFPLELTSDKTLTAVWSKITTPDPIRHTITFDTGLGSNIDPITDYLNAIIQNPGVPIKAGYDFDGWSSDKIVVTFPLTLTSDMTLTASWIQQTPPIDVFVTLVPNGGTLTSSSILTTQINSTINLPSNPTKSGYTFIGWFDGDYEFDFLSLIASDITLQARWRAGTDGLVYIISNMQVLITGYVGSDLHVIIPASISGYPVRTIGISAFANLPIASIILPVGLQTIGSFAFQNTNITEIVIPSTVSTISAYAFSGVTTLTTVTLNEGLTSILSGAFQNTGITEIDIPSTVTGISGFENTNLSSITLPHGLLSIGNGAFRNTNLTEIEIPQTVTSIGAHAFDGIDTLTSVTLNEGLQTIGNAAFANTGITEIVIPSTIRIIGRSVFQNIPTLTSITLPEGLQSIEDFSFENSSITELIIPSTVTSIGWRAFFNANISELVIPSSVTRIDSFAFAEINSLRYITLNEGLQLISMNAFASSSIAEIEIPSSVTSIASFAFAEISTLTSITLNEGLQIIASAAFQNTSIIEVLIPASVEVLADDAFPPLTNVIRTSTPGPTPVACGKSVVISKLFTSNVGVHNNAIELFNTSSNYIDLSVYTIRIFPFWSSTNPHEISLTGLIIAPNEFFTIIGNYQTNWIALNTADFTYHSNLVFSGNSPVALWYDANIVDIVGYRHQNSNNFSTRSTLIRINNPSSWQQSSTFNTFNFIRYAPDVWQYFGNFGYSIYSREQMLRGPRLENRVHDLPFRNPSNLNQGGGGVMQVDLSRVLDGDTSWVWPRESTLVSGLPTTSQNSTAIRYYGLEAPEVFPVDRAQPWGFVSGFFNRNFIHHAPGQQDIFIQSIPGETILDATGGRILGLVWVDGQLSQFNLLLNGLGYLRASRSHFDNINIAMTYRSIPLLTFKLFAQNEAQSLEIGLWPEDERAYTAPDWNAITNQPTGASTITGGEIIFTFPNHHNWQPHFPIIWD